MTQETQKWLADLKATGKITEEQFKALETAAGTPEVDQFIKDSALRQADYSRHMDEISKARKAVEDAARELQNKEAAVTKYQADLGTWKAGAEEKFNAAVRAAEGSSTKLAAALNRLKAIAVANGLDEADVLKDLDAPSNPPVVTPTIDTSKFLTAEQLAEQVREAARTAAFVDASIHDIAVEHQKLFGVPLPSAKDLVAEAIKAGKTLDQYWSEKFKVPEKQAEVREAEINERIKKAVDEATARLTSEQVLAGQHNNAAAHPVSPVFRESITKPLPVDYKPGGGISAALAAHAAGKYQNKQ
jgi:hypothetical protein